jgi:hypothetical protein
MSIATARGRLRLEMMSPVDNHYQSSQLQAHLRKQTFVQNRVSTDGGR